MGAFSFVDQNLYTQKLPFSVYEIVLHVLYRNVHDCLNLLEIFK